MARANSWKPEEIRILMDNKDRLTCSEIAELLPGRTGKAINSYCKKHNIRKGDEARSRFLKTVKIFTPEQHEFFLENYKGTDSCEMARMLNERFGTCFTPAQIHGFRQNHKLQNGNDTRWKKGHVPFTKGKKWDEFMSKDKQEHVRNSTCYTVGNSPNNLVPIGTVQMKSCGYLYKKVDDQKRVSWRVNWKPLHILNWEAVNGPVKEGNVLVFLDGDVTNCDVSNLREVSREANGYARIYKPLGKEVYGICLDAGQIKAKLKEIKDGTDKL